MSRRYQNSKKLWLPKRILSLELNLDDPKTIINIRTYNYYPLIF